VYRRPLETHHQVHWLLRLVGIASSQMSAFDPLRAFKAIVEERHASSSSLSSFAFSELLRRLCEGALFAQLAWLAKRGAFANDGARAV
jgi:hypothetical protein